MRRPPASDYPPCWSRMSYVRHELSMPGGAIALLQPSDAAAHMYPHGGLYRADQSAKPIVAWLKSFRREILA